MQQLFAAEAIDAIVFDVIGTLVDDDGAFSALAGQIAADTGLGPGFAEPLETRWKGALDRRMDAVIAGDDPWRPHRDLVREAAHEAIAALGGTVTPSMSDRLAAVDREYVAWPDVADATRALRQDRLIAGVSNGDLDSLARLANRNRITWDLALSTGSVRTFKPAPAAYRFAIDALRIVPGRTLFVAAHPWDLRAAAVHGFRTAFVARPGAERPSEADHFDLSVSDLTDLAGLLGR